MSAPCWLCLGAMEAEKRARVRRPHYMRKQNKKLLEGLGSLGETIKVPECYQRHYGHHQEPNY